MGALSFENWPYLGIFAVLIACSLGLPLPEDVPLLTSGFLCHRGLASVYFMVPIAMTGVLSGDIILYWLGRKFGHHIVEHRFVRRLVNAQRLLMAERLFQRHGVKIIFIGRFLPGLRPMIFVASGVLKVRFLTFVAINGLAACISVPTLVLLGKAFGNNLERIKHDVRAATHGILLFAAVSALIAGAVYFHRRQKSMMQSVGVPGDVPPEALPSLPPGGSPPEPASEDGSPSISPVE